MLSQLNCSHFTTTVQYVFSFKNYRDMAVSYTHLDVYKRQDFSQFPQFFQLIIHLLVTDDGQYHMVFKMNFLVFFKYGFAAVSYTHLDVYKRQPLLRLTTS